MPLRLEVIQNRCLCVCVSRARAGNVSALDVYCLIISFGYRVGS